MSLRFAIALATLTLAAGAAAQQSPGCRGGGFDDFDFWLGEWRVYATSNDALAGTNSITKHHAGCLIKEEWVSASGGGGFSMNFYNPVTETWRQVWVAAGYTIDTVGGLDASGAMVLEGSLTNYGTRVTSKFRGRWTPQENGSVIQHFDIHDAATDSWSVWFEGRYVRPD